MPPMPPIPNTYWVRPGQLLAGEYPGDWDEVMSRQKLRRLLEAGVSFFVDPNSVPAARLTVPTVTELAREIEQARLEANLSAEELLRNLREQRKRYYREQHTASQSE